MKPPAVSPAAAATLSPSAAATPAPSSLPFYPPSAVGVASLSARSPYGELPEVGVTPASC